MNRFQALPSFASRSRRELASRILLPGLLLLFAANPTAAHSQPWEGEAFSADPTTLRRAVAALPIPTDAEAQVLLFETEHTLEATGLTAYRERQVYRILKPSGLGVWSTLEVPWSPWYQERPRIRARVITADGRVQTLEESTIAEAPAGSGDPDLFDDERLLRAPLPAMAVGALVETEVTIRHSQPLFRAGEVYRQWLAMTVPVRLARVILESPADLPLQVRSEGLEGTPPEPVRAGARVRRVYELADVPAVVSIDPGLPPEVPLAPYVAFSTGSSWADVARAYSEIVDRTAAAPGNDGDPLAAFAPASGSADDALLSQWEQIQSLLTTLHREVRYTGLEFADGGIVPRSPAETLARRFGDCKDKAVLLATLLRREGIPAYVALLNAGVGPDIEAELPGLGLFNHAIVYVPGGSPIWIDATDPYTRLGELPPLAQGRWALVASPNTRGLVRTPEATPEDNLTEETRDLHLAPLGKARVVEASTMVGSPARQIRASWDGAEEQEIRKSLENYVRQTYDAGGITRLTHTPLSDTGRQLAIELEAEEAGYGVTDLGQAVVLISLSPMFERLPAGLMGDEGEDETPRRHDFVLIEPYRITWHYRIHIPANLELRHQPDDKRWELGPAVFQRSFSLTEDGRRLDAHFSFDTDKRRFSPTEVDAFRAGVHNLDEEGQGRMLIWFDQTVPALLAAGRPQEAMAESRRLFALWPDRILPRVLSARALLSLGLGEEARRLAAEAVAMEPETPAAHKVRAWVLVHDEVGRHFHAGFDRQAAAAAYRKALELEPDDGALKGDLAILLEHDDEGTRYSDDADLDAAIDLYREVGDGLAESGLVNNLLIDLLWRERFEELRKELDRFGDTDERAHLSLAATAALQGPEAALRSSSRRFTDAGKRVQALASAAQQLLLLRRYDEAAALFRGAGRSSPNAAALLSLADLVGRLEHHEEMSFSDETPEAVVRAFFHALIAQGKPDLDRLATLMSEPVRAGIDKDDRESTNALIAGALDAVRSLGMSPDVLADLVLSGLTTQPDGDDARGYTIDTRVNVAGQTTEMTAYVVREGSAYRMVGTERSLAPLSLQILDLLERGDEAAARAWLDRVHAIDPVSASEDPLQGRLFLRFWKPGAEVGARAMREAAALLLLEGGRQAEISKRLVPILEAGRRDAPEDERLRFDLGLMGAYLLSERWKEARDTADRLLAAEPDSEFAFRMALDTRSILDDLDGFERLIRERLERRPDDKAARLARLSLAQARGNLDRAAELAAELVAEGNEAVLNNAAWLALVRERVDEEVLSWARKGAEATEYRSRAVLHTLATAYAELGQPAEAYRVLLQSMELSDGEPQTIDWYVFGRMAEDYGLPEVARGYYQRVEKPEDDEVSPLSTWSMAQKRLERLGPPPKGRDRKGGKGGRRG